MLWEEYDIAVTQSCIHKILVKNSSFTIKRLEKISQVRNSPVTIKKRTDLVKTLTKTSTANTFSSEKPVLASISDATLAGQNESNHRNPLYLRIAV